MKGNLNVETQVKLKPTLTRFKTFSQHIIFLWLFIVH